MCTALEIFDTILLVGITSVVVIVVILLLGILIPIDLLFDTKSEKPPEVIDGKPTTLTEEELWDLWHEYLMQIVKNQQLKQRYGDKPVDELMEKLVQTKFKPLHGPPWNVDKK
jgi:hypothetical protein